MSYTVNTYDGLVAAITNWTNRNDTLFVQNIPLFISLAEQEFFIDCSTLGNEIYVTGIFNANSGIVPKPAMWGQTLSFSYLDSSNNVHVLKRVSYEYIRGYIENNTTITPEYTNYISNTNTLLPKYYTDYGYDNFLISATPTVAYAYEIAYFQKIQPLTSANQTNWITQYAYDAFFWLCLDKAFRYVEDVPNADMYLSKAKERMEHYVKYSTDRQWDRTSNSTKG